jgi:type IV pilus assembly protein PilE
MLKKGMWMMKGKEGVTLLEVMIVVVIVGILAAVAIPAYNNYITRSRRSAAFVALETVRAAQEMYRAEKGEYRNGNDFAANLLPGCSSVMAGDNYTISVLPAAGIGLIAYTVTAASQHKQAGDYYFRIDQDGNLSYSSDNGSTWKTDKKLEDLR